MTSVLITIVIQPFSHNLLSSTHTMQKGLATGAIVAAYGKFMAGQENTQALMSGAVAFAAFYLADMLF